MSTDVSPFLAPESVAIVGASDRPGNLGGVSVELLQKFGYPGRVWPVHPTAEDVGGLIRYPSVAELPASPDLAVLAVPAAAAPSLIEECADAGISHGVLWSGGFAEAGPDGVAGQQRLVETCRARDFKLLGPNCLGVIDTHLPVTLTFASFLRETDRLLAGDISMVSQSGGISTMAQAMSERRGAGFRYTISTGNEAVLGVSDFLSPLADDPETKVIGLYLEGVGDGPRFIEAMQGVRSAGKPIVVLKAGATRASAAAAAAHTGALVGEQRVWASILDELGVIQVRSLEEMLDVLLEISSLRPDQVPQGDGMAAVTFGGGMGVLAVDQAALRGLDAPTLSCQTRELLRPLVPAVAAIANPVDLTPQTYLDPRWLEHMPAALRAISCDPGIDSVLIQAGPMATEARSVAEIIGLFRQKSEKPVLVAWPLAPPAAVEQLEAMGVHIHEESDRAIRVLGSLVAWARHDTSGPVDTPPTLAFDWAAFTGPAAPGTILGEDRCRHLLAGANIPVAAGGLARSRNEAVSIASDIGFPVAMKGIAPGLLHRAAAGLVSLGVDSREVVLDEYQRLDATASMSGIDLEGVYVQAMVEDGGEVLVSAFRDPTFGVMISVGAGGVMTESIDEVHLRRAPFGADEARRLISALQQVQLPKTGDPGHDELIELVSDFSRLAATAPWSSFVLEMNPVRVTPDRAVAIDALLVITEP